MPCPKSRLSGYRTDRGSERDKNSINLNGGGAILVDQIRNIFRLQLESLSRSLPRAVLYQALCWLQADSKLPFGAKPAVSEIGAALPHKRHYRSIYEANGNCASKKGGRFWAGRHKISVSLHIIERLVLSLQDLSDNEGRVDVEAAKEY